MPAKIPKPSFPINADSNGNGLLHFGKQLFETKTESLQTQKTQMAANSDTKASNDVQKHLKTYLLAVAKTGCSSSTIRNYRSDINQFLDFADSNDLNDLRNKPKLLAFAHYQREKGLKENSIKRKLISITQFKIWLKQQGLINSEIPLAHLDNSTESESSLQKNELLARKIINQEPTKEPKKIKTLEVKKANKNRKPQSRVFLLLNLLALFLFLGGLAYFAYQQFGQAIISLAYPSTPTAPNRILSYQGRLTNTAQSPISDPTSMTYTLYDDATGGSILWASNTCTIDPDQDGIFNANLGAGSGTGADNENCGGNISEDVFTLHNNVWLEVAVGAEILAPRQPIRTVAYALNAATLQGLPVSEVASNSTILMMNSAGEVVLGTDNPIIKAATSSSGMTIEANQITIQTTTGSNGDIILAPDGDGEVLINSADLVLNDGTIYSNRYAPASNSADISFVLPVSGNNLNFLDNSGLSTLITITGDGQMGIGTATPNHALDIAGNLGLNTGAYINWGATDGETGYGLRDNGGTLQYKSSGGTWANIGSGGGGDSLWVDNNETISPANLTQDVLIGGNSTAAATIALKSNGDSRFKGDMSVGPLGHDYGIGIESNLFVGRDYGDYGAKKANIYAYRGGNSSTEEGGTSFSANGIDSAIMGYSDFGNNYSAGVAGYSWLNYANSAGVLGSDEGGSMWGALGFNDGTNKWAGYFDGDGDRSAAFMDGNVGIGTTTPGALLGLAAATSGKAQLNLVSSIGVDPTTPNNGDLWWNGTNLNFYDGSSTVDLLAGGGDSLWVDAGTYIYPLDGKPIGNPTSGGTNKVSGLYMADSGPLYFGTDNDINFSFSGSTFTTTLGLNAWNIANDLLYLDGTTNQIGIGTTSPLATLDVRALDTDTPVASFSGATNLATLIVDQSGSGDIFTASASGQTQFVITKEGNVGIGLSNPDEKLTVSGSINAEKYYDFTNKNYFLDPAAISTSLKTAGDAHIGGDVYVEGGEIFITPMSFSTSTTEGTIYYDDDVDHLYLYDGNSTWHRIALDMTKYSNYGTISNQDYIQIAHNQNSNDLTFTVWIKDKITNLWRKIDPTSSSIDHDMASEFNPEFTQKEKVTSVSLKLQNDSTGTGADGAITVSTSRSINSYNSISGRTCSDGGDAVNYSVTGLTSTTATLEAAPSTGCLAIGDEVLLINLRGTPSAYGNVGNYETLRIQSIDTSTNTIAFTTAKTKYYGDGIADDTNIGIGTGAQDVMLQRVPNYTNVTVDATYSFYPDEWVRPSGSAESGAGGAGEGGVMFFRATGTVTVNGTITTLGRGYIAGTYAGDNVQQYQGDSTTGVGAQINAFKAEGGGGGSPLRCSGGGGGGYATAGTVGTRAGSSCSTGGIAGPAYPTAGNATLNKLYFGSGGGAGGTGYDGSWAPDGTRGGDGGGVIYIAANTVNVSGAVTSTGEAGTNRADVGGTDIAPGAGGGGAGGSLKIVGNTLNLGTSKVTANGGVGGTTGYSNYGGSYADFGGYAHGGAGGSGIVAVGYLSSIDGSTSPSYTSLGSTYNPYAIYVSEPINTPGTTAFNNISWTETLPTGTELQVQTRSGSTADPADGTWEAWRPSVLNTNYVSLDSANTHTDWTGTNLTVAEGDVARNVDGFEDEDEENSGNLIKTISTSANGYVERTIGSTNISSYTYISAWIRSAAPGQVVTLGMGESAATEQTKTFYIDQANVWQKVYWDISNITGANRDAITKLRLTNITNGNIIYFDNIKAETYLSTSTGSTITSTANNYIQYRFILTTRDGASSPTLSNVKINLTNADGTKTIDADSIINPNAPINNQVSRRTDPTILEYSMYSTGTGADGAITVSTSRSINSYNSISGRTCSDGGDAVNYSVTGLTSTTATLEAAPSTGCLAIGDEVLLINLRGTPSAYGNVGNYETLRIQSIDTSTNTIAFTTAKTKYYGDGIADDTNIGIGTGAQDVMLQRVPNYTNVTVDATYSFYPDEWVRPSGSAESGAGGAGEGGVMFFRATGTVTVNGTITTLGRGYIAGTYAGDNVQQYQGDSTTGVGAQINAFKAEGGGGGSPLRCSGGGGGGYATAGTVGTRAGSSCSTGGIAGPAYPTAGNATLNKLYFGSGGGAGGTGYDGSWAPDGTRGGDGGGVIYIAANTVNVSGAVTSTGEAGTNRADVGGTDIAPGAGGGGAGGSLKIVGNTLNLGASKVTANGGAGGTTGYSNYGGSYADFGGYAHGGAGGSGIVATYYAGTISGSTSPTYTIDTATGEYNSYKTYISKELAVTGANSFGNLEWTENLPSGTEIQMQTRSGNTSNSIDGTWEAWRPTTTTLSINDANTHTDWIGTNATIADGDVTRNINYYEDEDESTVGNITKYTTSAANGYAERTLSSTNLSSYQYISLWIRSANAGSIITLGMGESAATEQTKTIKVETSNVWQKVYWDISSITGTARDAITKFRITSSINANVVYFDNIKAETYLSTSTGSAITSTANNYIQYRAIMTTTSASVTPTLAEVRINYNDGSAKIITDKLSNQNDTDYYNQESLLNITTTSLDNSKSLDIQKTETGITTKGAIDPGTGNDGDIVISTDRNINTYNSISGRTCSDGGDAVNYSITALTPRTATLTTAPSTGCLIVGDEVLLINLKGNATSTINVGNYETLRVESISDNVIRFTTAKTKFYGDNSTDDSNIGTDSGNQNVMLQRVPNYNSLVVNAGISFFPSDFDGLKNGVMFFRSKITSINGSITAKGSGYRGTTYAGDDLQQYQGSSTTGTGIQSINFKAEGGGGGAQYHCAGGGGGGYATAGTDGIRAGTACQSPGAGGPSYPTYGNPSLSKLYLGSGGGAGATGYNGSWAPDGGGGGSGGGIVYIASDSLVVSGYLRADGNNGTSIADVGGTDISPGGGGGGAGGSLKIEAQNINLGSSLTLANGGTGGTTGYSNYGSSYADLGGYSTGGNGGNGIVAITYGSSISGSSNPTYNINQVPAYTSSVFVSDEIATPNAVSYDKISWLANETPYGIVEVQTRSGATSNSTDGSWEEWKPSISNATILNSADTHTDWTASDTTITVSDGDVTRNINYYEDEDESTVGNITKLTTTSNSVAYAESKIVETNLSQKSFITLWVYSSNSGSTVKIGFGENTSSEHETLVKIDAVDTWQKVYWDISHIPAQERDAVRFLKVGTAVTNNTIRFDQFTAQKFANDPAGTVVASRPNEYFQYRIILGSSSPAYRPVLYNIGMSWNNGYKVEQTNTNTVRLYNYTGDEQEMRLDVIVFGADLAEWYTVNDENIGPADLVSITGEMDEYGVPILRKTDKSNDHMLVGVISTQAGKELGIKADNRRLLALDGRVPVKIDPTSSAIEKGDHLTSSGKPGLARKAKPGELSIGRSFESWNSSSDKDRVLAIVNDAMATPSFGQQLVDGVVEIADLLNLKIKDNWEIVNYDTNETVKSAAALAQAIIGKLKVGQMEVSEIKAPEGEKLSLEGSNIAIQLDDPEASGSSALGKLIIQNQDGETVASFDSEGNASISGQLDVAGISRLGKLIADEATFDSIITEEASISGSLVADNIQAESARLDYIESKLANLENASVSGTLYAENIQANNIQANMISGLEERLSSKIAETLNQPSLLASLFGEQAQQTDEYLQQLQQELNDITTENEDASLSELNQESGDLTLIADSAFVDQYFEVNGNAFIADSLKLGQSLMVGEDTIIGNGFISYQPQLAEGEDFTFSIQPTGMGKLSLMAGLMQLDGKGFVSINGDVKVAGALEVEDKLKVKDTLLTNLISANKAGESIKVQLASLEESLESEDLIVQKSNFEFINENNNPVASFSATGDLALTGSLRLGQKVEIASNSGELINSRSAGQAILEAGKTEITIMSDKIEENSMIYVTPMNSTNNQVLYVKNKTTDSPFTPENEAQFTVAIDYALGHNVVFNWWIIQLN